MEKVEWDLLKILNVCSRHRNFNEAASEAGVLPSAFSKQIKRLEQQVGIEIFERVNGNASNKFTPSGLKLLKKTLKVEKILFGKNDLVDPVQEDLDVKIYTNQSIASNILPKITKNFRKEYPKIPIHLITSISPSIIEIDSILIRTDFKLQKNIVKLKLLDFETGFYASEEYIKKNGSPRRFSDLENHSLLYFYGNRHLEKIAGKEIFLSPTITSTDINYSYLMCLEGEGILELPTVYKGCKQLIRVLKEEPLYEQSIFIGCCSKNIRTSSVSKFIKLIEEIIKNQTLFSEI